MTRVVDWGLAERVASLAIATLPPRGPGPSTGRYTGAEVEIACAEALETVAAYARLGAVTDPPAAELIGRRTWAAAALATMAEAARPVEARLATQIAGLGPVSALARRAVGAALGTEVGAASGYAAKRVLGQYDLALFGPPRRARLLLVAENLDAARRDLGADRDLFLRWVALHETTHVVQFERVEWLTDHLRELAARVIEGAADGFDAGDLVAGARRIAREPREVVRALLRGELARLLADPERRELLDRLQATMSVVEGHAEHVMDACAEEHGPELVALRHRLDRRRARRGGLGELLARLLGLDLKLRQYEAGKAFCDEVVAEAGSEGLASLWTSAEQLPDLAELAAPRRWLERVAAVPA